PQITQALGRLTSHAESSHLTIIDTLQGDLDAPAAALTLPAGAILPGGLTSAIAAFMADHPAQVPILMLFVRLLDQLLVPALDETYHNIQSILQRHGIDRGSQKPGMEIDHAATGVLDREALLAHLDAIQERVCSQALDTEPELHKLRGVPELPHEAVLVPELQRLMDLMGLMVYDGVTAPNLCSSFKAPLLRMHLPLLKAVLLDGQVLHNANHPVRQLWSRLLELARTPNADQAPWRPRVERIVSSLCSDFRHDLGIFEKALEKLRTAEHLPRDITPAMQRAPSRSSPGISFNEARTAATQSVQAILAAQGAVPPTLRTFLLQTWGPLMLLIAQRAGPQGDEWETAHAMMRELVAFAAPHPVEPETALRPLLDRMQALLTKNGLGQKGFHQAFEELHQALQKSMARPQAAPAPEASHPPPLSLPEPVPMPAGLEGTPGIKARTILQAGAVASGTPAAHVAEAHAEPQAPPAAPPAALPGRAVEEFIRLAFHPGDWYLVHAGDAQVPRRLKAFLVDDTLGMLVFSDRLERPILERPIAQFVEDVLAGRSHPVFEDERYSHALKQLRQNISASTP
ncbi:MAG TPA: DUF1631 family protein, partial [Chromatiales bacterium]|nr:DUF1631 family protein [Chromatiales bacterium]